MPYLWFSNDLLQSANVQYKSDINILKPEMTHEIKQYILKHKYIVYNMYTLKPQKKCTLEVVNFIHIFVLHQTFSREKNPFYVYVCVFVFALLYTRLRETSFL